MVARTVAKAATVFAKYPDRFTRKCKDMEIWAQEGARLGFSREWLQTVFGSSGSFLFSVAAQTHVAHVAPEKFKSIRSE